jgi:hypothetical protein
VGQLTQAVQAVVEEPVQVAFVDQGYTGEEPAADAEQAGIHLQVIKHHDAKRGFVLLPRRWSSAPSPGQRVSGAWLGITNACQQP